MGPLIVIIFWAILLTPLGVFLGLVLMFAGTSILYRFRKTPKESQLGGWAKFGFSVLFTMVFVPVMCLLGIYMMDNASIGKWKDGSSIVTDITEYEKQGALLAGYCRDIHFGSNAEHWFLFDCTTGRADDYANKESF